MKNPDFEYDEIADKVFFPIYDYIADQIIERTGKKEGILLDIGCGGGHLGFTVLQKTDMTGSFADINATALSIARERAKEYGLDDRSEFFECDVHAMPFDDGFADLITSRGSYHFWMDQEKAFSEIFRVLAPGGVAYVGAGLGSPAQREQIFKTMKAQNENWAPPKSEEHHGLETPEYAELFKSKGWNATILDDEEGRWFIIRK